MPWKFTSVYVSAGTHPATLYYSRCHAKKQEVFQTFFRLFLDMFQRLSEDGGNVRIRQRVKNGFSLTAADHEPGLFQNTKLVGDGGLGHFQFLRNIPDAFFVLKEDENDPYPCQIAKDLEQLCHVCQL